MVIQVIAWALLGLCFLLFEMSNPGFFYFLSFFFACCTSALSAFFGGTFEVQIFIFFIVFTCAFWLLKIKAQKSNNAVSPTNMYALVGAHAMVTREIAPGEFGYVKINGEVWMAKNKSQELVPEGVQVVVVRVQGAHVVVKKA